MADDGPAIEIEAISYSPVGAKRPTEDFWADCVVGDDIEEPVRVRFVGYMRRCYEAKQNYFGEIVFETDDGKALNQKLTKIRKFPFDKENKERREVTQELADRLSKKMAAAGGGAPSGAIFVVQAMIAKKQFIALLKLDLERAEVVALKSAKLDRHLVTEVFERALPTDSDNFRKGVLVPSPGDGDGRSGQVDNFSQYWHEFVGAKPFREAMTATRGILMTAMKALRGEGKDLAAKVASNLIDKVARTRDRDSEKVAAVIKEVTGVRKAPNAIKEELEKNLGRAALTDIAPVAKHVFQFSRGIRLIVKADEITKGLVTVEEHGNDVVIRIKNSKLKHKALPGRPE